MQVLIDIWTWASSTVSIAGALNGAALLGASVVVSALLLKVVRAK